MIPQIDSSLTPNIINIVSYPNKTYKLVDNQIIGKVDDLEAIKQSIYHILSIERYANLIYDDNYGVELEQYIGKSFEYLESTIENTLKDALMQDDRILDVQVTNITKSVQRQEMIDKTKLYKKLTRENKDILETEIDEEDVVTEKFKKLGDLSISEALVALVEFDVYCKQGVLNLEVKINV